MSDIQEPKSNARSAAETAGYYDALWTGLHESLAEKVAVGSEGEARIRFIQRSLSNIRRTTQSLEILDLGCGSGWCEVFMAEYGRITAVDYSPEGIRLARELYSEFATFFLADPASPTLGIPEILKYDVVVSTEVIEHVPDQFAYVRQIGDFLKPSGWCVLTTPNENLWDKFRRDERYLKWRQPIENWVAPGHLEAIFRRAGFTVHVHEGWSNMNYAYDTLSNWLLNPGFQKLFATSAGQAVWKRLMLRYGLMQFMVAQKIST